MILIKFIYRQKTQIPPLRAADVIILWVIIGLLVFPKSFESENLVCIIKSEWKKCLKLD